MLNELVENRATHSSWLDKVDLYVLPLANPDGYEYSHSGDRMWRKNRRRGSGEFRYCTHSTCYRALFQPGSYLVTPRAK